MITAIVLLNLERGKVDTVAEKLAGLEGISEVYSVAGRYDLTVIIRVSNHEDLVDVVTKHMLKLEGIKKSETLVTFRVYSRHDLERMFSMGTEGKKQE